MEINPKTILIGIVVIIILTAGTLFASGFFKNKTIVEGFSVGDKAIKFDVIGVNNDQYSLEDSIGKLVFLDFIAPECPACLNQFDEFKTITHFDNVEIITINIDNRYSIQTLKNFKRDENFSWFFGHSPSVGYQYNVRFIPTVILVDQDGIIRYRGNYTPEEELLNLIKMYE